MLILKANILTIGSRSESPHLTRVTLADLLCYAGVRVCGCAGVPVSLIFHDQLVNSDDGRLDAMTETLEEGAQRMQMILLTCLPH